MESEKKLHWPDLIAFLAIDDRVYIDQIADRMGSDIRTIRALSVAAGDYIEYDAAGRYMLTERGKAYKIENDLSTVAEN